MTAVPMLAKSLLIANRGEIAIRIMRAAAELGVRTVAVFSDDDSASLHLRKADDARALRGAGVAAYLDAEQIVAAAQDAGCDAIHPGYGFLSENAKFARRCAAAGICFVGPRPETLELFGDKLQARALAQRCGVPVLRGTTAATNLDEARAFFASLGEGGAMMIKAVAGGGGRGMRAVHRAADVEQAFARCQSEARSAFGIGDVYVEQLMPSARHLEVQIVGDGSGEVVHLYERECTIQRRNQKILEIAPSPSISAETRDRLTGAAVRIAREVRYDSLGTFEFLLAAAQARGGASENAAFAFIEANPRLQVEHTVTEEVTGVDLVKVQLQLAGGMRLADLGLTQIAIAPPRGFAIQARINAETMTADGGAKPAGGTLAVFELPSGPGLRIDTFAYAGYTTNPRFDSLIAKLIARSSSGDFSDAVNRTYRALCEFRIEGIATNIGFLQNLLRHPEFAANRIHTRFVEEHAAELTATQPSAHRRLFFERASAPSPGRAGAGARIDTSDPLAVLHHGKSESAAPADVLTVAAPAPPAHEVAGPEGTVAITAPMQGTIVSIDTQEGDTVRRGQQLLVMEAMKMEHVIAAQVSGVVRQISVAKGDAVFEGHPLIFIEQSQVEDSTAAAAEQIDLDRIRPDLAEVHERHALGLDPARPDAVARRRKTHQRTARENVDDLCDPGTYIEYGSIVIAAQRRRRALDDLIKRTPADGLIAGIGRVNGDLFEDAHAQCVLMSYDYTVLAGTQGQQNHRKKDRMFEIAEQMRLPVVFFTEGGGGRPGDTDGVGVAGLDCMAFQYWGQLSGLVPLIGINSGRCFAGNAALLGCCDVVIATENSNIGMGGPAMIEGGGLGIFRPEEVGPMRVQVANGVVDIPVKDEAGAVNAAKKLPFVFSGGDPQVGMR